MTKKKEYSPAVIMADAVAITHLLFGTIAILLGELTGFFSSIDVKHGGVKFVFYYLDAPIYYLLAQYMPATQGDTVFMLCAGIAIVVFSSIVYGLLVYLIFRFASSLFAPEKT